MTVHDAIPGRKRLTGHDASLIRPVNGEGERGPVGWIRYVASPSGSVLEPAAIKKFLVM